MQRGIERAVLHLQKFVRGPLNVLPDLVTVSRSMEKRPQDEHVKRSLEEPDPLLCLLRHKRQSTLDLAVMVDIRLSIVKGRRQSVWILEWRLQSNALIEASREDFWSSQERFYEQLTSVKTLLKAFFASKGQHERQSRKVADTVDLH